MTLEGSSSINSRLFYNLLIDSLKEIEIELIEIKSIRFLAKIPWQPGKRLRPIIFLLSNMSIQVEQSIQPFISDREVRLAAAIELLHEASLIHDDLVDRSCVRRGVPTIQMNNGAGMALLIGDYMIFRSLKLIIDAARSQNDIHMAQELANASLKIAHGEIDQLDRHLNRNYIVSRMSIDEYLEVIAKKTATFFAGCAEAGAYLAGSNRTVCSIYRDFGMNLGLVFQIVDDLMDILGDPDKAKKTLRNNISEGTITLPMIHAYTMNPDHPALCQLSNCNAVKLEYEDDLYKILSSKEVLNKCFATIDIFISKAMEQLHRMPSNIYRLGLADMLDYISLCPWGGLESKLSQKKCYCPNIQ